MTRDASRSVPAATIPAVTADQMREVDRAMIEDFHIELVQMMENAGRNLADLATGRFGPAAVVVIAGPGGNGGGGLVAARHLANRGVAVRVVTSRPDDELTPVAAHQLDVVRRMGIPVATATGGDPDGPADPADPADPAGSDLVIDALIGYSLRGDPSGPAAPLIGWTNRQRAPVLALDTPSGLDVTTGRPGSPCVRATATLTLALPKTGLLGAPAYVGDLYVADISVPPALYERMGLRVPPLFGQAAIVELGRAGGEGGGEPAVGAGEEGGGAGAGFSG